MGELKNELRSRQTDRASRRSRSGTTNSLMFPSWLWFCLAGRGELQPDRKAAGTGGDSSVRQHPNANIRFRGLSSEGHILREHVLSDLTDNSAVKICDSNGAANLYLPVTVVPEERNFALTP